MIALHSKFFTITYGGSLAPDPNSITLNSPPPVDCRLIAIPLTPPVLKIRKTGGPSRAWEAVSAKKAARFFPDLDPGFLDNKFRWGAFKAFAYTKGGPVAEIIYPVAAANGMDWLVEKNYVKPLDGKLILRKKGLDLYNALFKGNGPRDFLL